MPSINFLKPVLIPVLTLVVDMGVLVLVLVPTLKSIPPVQKQLDSVNERVGKLSQKITTLNSMDESKLRGLLQTANNAVPSDKNVPGLLSGLERAAQAASASIEGFAIAPGKIGTSSAAEATPSASAVIPKEKNLAHGVAGIPFKAVLKGGYLALHDFLASLYKSNRLLNVDNVVFSTSKSGSSDVVSSLDLYLYYQPEPKTLGSSEVGIEQITLAQENAINSISSYPVFTSSPPVVPTGKSNPFAR